MAYEVVEVKTVTKRADSITRQNFKDSVKTSIYMLGYVWKEKKGRTYTLCRLLLSIYSVLPRIISIIFPGLIINELTTHRRIEVIIAYLTILLVMPVADRSINRLVKAYLEDMKQFLSAKFLREYNYHTAMMDYETLENPDIQDLSVRASGTCSGAVSVVDRLSSLLSACIELAAIFSILASLNVAIILVVLLVIYINSIITKKLKAKQYENKKKLSRYSRYLNSLLIVLDYVHYAKEVRVFNLKSYFAEMLFEKRLAANGIKSENTKAELNAQVGFSITNIFQQIIVYTYMIYKVLVDGLSIGGMTIYMTSVEKFANTYNSLVKNYLEIAGKALDIQEFKEFMEMPLKQYKSGNRIPKIGSKSKIEFKNVSFKYPGSQTYALKNLNITINLDEKLCVVGANGSGKTTMIKLLTRLYFPTEGEIFLDGVNINEFDYEQYQSIFSPVFQNYALFCLSLADNIALENNYDITRIKNVYKKAGLDNLVDKLPKGIDTLLFKIFDNEGFEPSGGEGQKIAIARAFYHDASLYLLDEPTAALDPNAEYEIYSKFNEMIKDRAAVLITHRLSAVQLANKVAVFDKGNMVEYGTHRDLYKKGGVYTEMFDKQAQFYRYEGASKD